VSDYPKGWRRIDPWTIGAGSVGGPRVTKTPTGQYAAEGRVGTQATTGGRAMVGTYESLARACEAAEACALAGNAKTIRRKG